jgi:hypothetical protein
MEELKARIDAYVKAADAKTLEYWTGNEFTHAPAPTHRADYISDKWVRVVTLEVRNGKPEVSSVHSFVALQDGHTKALGTIKAGDIHKAAGFKAPAKTARGSVFAEDFNNCLTAHGVQYLK